VFRKLFPSPPSAKSEHYLKALLVAVWSFRTLPRRIPAFAVVPQTEQPATKSFFEMLAEQQKNAPRDLNKVTDVTKLTDEELRRIILAGPGNCAHCGQSARQDQLKSKKRPRDPEEPNNK